ncbi:MAG: SUMF1/EgtB/PvdO family nonheme iron enzyme [Planctomycetota bacterium]
MAREPGQRYASTAELAHDLRAFLDGRVVRAWRSGPLAELAAWYRRHRATAATALVAALALVALATWFVLRLDQARDRAAEAARAAEASLRELDELAVSERVDDLRRRGDDLWPLAPAQEPRLRAWLDEAAALRPVRDALQARRAATRNDADSPAPALAQRWRDRLLARTLQDLAVFLDSVPATPFADANQGAVAARLELLVSLRRAAEGDASRRWSQAAEDLRADGRFAGTRLRPQFDLLPLGRDPQSGLLEFAHLPSGVAPTRDADGRLRLAPECGIVLVLLPGGTFAMGAQPDGPANQDPAAEANESPVHTLTLAPFFLAKHEMTQAQWLRTFGANPSNHDARSLFVDPARAPLHPVENVTWYECRTHMRRLGLELPTEAQWEYAARCAPAAAGGRDLAAPRANLSDRARARALAAQCPAFEASLDDGFVMHAPVGSFAADAWGLHDLFGNVWEWCRDEYCSYEVAARPGDGARPCDEKPQLAIYRGGAFDTLAVEARAANRAGAPPDVRQFTVGVRPARRLDESD